MTTPETAAAKEIEALRAQVEQYREDAERYAYSKTLEGQVLVIQIFRNEGADKLDAAIDKARKA